MNEIIISNQMIVSGKDIDINELNKQILQEINLRQKQKINKEDIIIENVINKPKQCYVMNIELREQKIQRLQKELSQLQKDLQEFKQEPSCKQPILQKLKSLVYNELNQLNSFKTINDNNNKIQYDLDKFFKKTSDQSNIAQQINNGNQENNQIEIYINGNIDSEKNNQQFFLQQLSELDQKLQLFEQITGFNENDNSEDTGESMNFFDEAMHLYNCVQGVDSKQIVQNIELKIKQQKLSDLIKITIEQYKEIIQQQHLYQKQNKTLQQYSEAMLLGDKIFEFEKVMESLRLLNVQIADIELKISEINKKKIQLNEILINCCQKSQNISNIIAKQLMPTFQEINNLQNLL